MVLIIDFQQKKKEFKDEKSLIKNLTPTENSFVDKALAWICSFPGLFFKLAFVSTQLFSKIECAMK